MLNVIVSLSWRFCRASRNEVSPSAAVLALLVVVTTAPEAIEREERHEERCAGERASKRVVHGGMAGLKVLELLIAGGPDIPGLAFQDNN